MRRLSRDQVNDAIDRARAVDRQRDKTRTITSGFLCEQAIPTWSEWRLTDRPNDPEVTLVTATFCVSTLDGPLWVVQHKSSLGTVRDEADVFIRYWTRSHGDPAKPERRKAPASMTLGERLKRAKSALAMVGAQLLGDSVDLPEDPESASVVLRARRMWAVIECARQAAVSRSAQDLDRLAEAIADLG